MLRKIALVAALLALAGAVFLVLNRPDRSKPPEPDTAATAPAPGSPGTAPELHKDSSWEFTKFDPDTNRKLYEISGEDAGVLAEEGAERVQVVRPVIEICNLPGKSAKVTAKRGTIEQSQAQLRSASLEGEVKIVLTEKGSTIASAQLEELLWEAAKGRFSSAGEVLLAYSGLAIQGAELLSSVEFDNIVLKRNVSVSLKPDPARNEPATTISCTGPLEFNRSLSQVSFHTQVKAVRGTLSLAADELVATFEKRTDALKPVSFQASAPAGGLVKVQDGDRAAEAETVVVAVDTASIRLFGKPARVSEKDRRLEASSIRIAEGGKLLTLEGADARMTWQDVAVSGSYIRVNEQTKSLTVKGAGQLAGTGMEVLPIPGTGQDTAQPAVKVYWQDSMTYSRAAGSMQFAGGVLVKRGNAALRCDTLKVDSGDAEGRPVGFQGEGDIRLELAGCVMHGDRLVYSGETHRFVFTGTESVQAGMTCGDIDLTTKRLEMSAADSSILCPGEGKLVARLVENKMDGGGSGTIKVSWNENMSFAREGDFPGGGLCLRFVGNVEAGSEGGKLRCGKLQLHFAPTFKEKGLAGLGVDDFLLLEARAGVQFSQTGNSPRSLVCERADWDKQQDVWSFKGQPVVMKQERLELSSPDIVVDQSKKALVAGPGGELVTYYEGQRQPTGARAQTDKLPVHIRWKGKLRSENEGRKATFLNEVVALAKEFEFHVADRLEIILTPEGKLERGFAYGQGSSTRPGLELTVGSYRLVGTRAGFDLSRQWYEVEGSPARVATSDCLMQAKKFRFQRRYDEGQNVLAAEGIVQATYRGKLRLPGGVATEVEQPHRR